MKSFVVTAILLVVLIGALTVNHIYIKEVFGAMNAALDALPDVGEEDCPARAAELQAYWEEQADLVSLSVSYTTVDRICEHAATGAPVPQRGSISCNRGHHWIIEDCQVNWSNALGIDVGNECWHHEHREDEMIGYSVIRGCTIRDAGVCGIAGLFAKHLLIEDNVIEGTGWQKMELSWEAGGIKLHDTVETLIRRNVFRNTLRADHLWLDCNNENNRITSNLFLGGIQAVDVEFLCHSCGAARG